MSFSSLPLSPSLLEVLAELGYSQMTPIQERAIPVLLQGRDLVGQSQTGSGKTVAFGVPIMEKTVLADRELQSLVLCPTRELCAQVARELRKLGRRLPGLQVQILAGGGEPVRAQVKSMSNGVHIAVATPGRLLDHLRRKSVSLTRVTRLVLDEADRMLDMGFADDIAEIIGQLPARRQTMFFSATFDGTIAAMSRQFQTNPVRVTVEDEPKQMPKIQQTFFQVGSDEEKAGALQALLKQHNPRSALVFCRLKVTVAALARQLGAAALHGDLEQFDRDRAMARFRNQSARVLVATDVAARGLDIADLDLVVNFDLPSHAEVYLHRIGRTGRAGKAGTAWSLGVAREQGKLEQYEKLTGSAVERVVYSGREGAPPPPGLGNSFSTLHIWGGRKDKMRPGDILGALTGASGLASGDVGKIEIHDKLSYVAVSAHLARAAAKTLREGSIKGRKFRVDVI